MPITPSRWTKDEMYFTECNLWYIISFLYEDNGHKPVDFRDLIWIVARANKEMFEKYTLDCVNVEIFNIINLFDFDKDLVPMNFRPKELTPKSWMDYMSEAQQQVIEHVYIKWKLYGKWSVRLKKLLERIKNDTRTKQNNS